MYIIFSTIIALFIILLFSSFAAWLEGKHKKDFYEKAIDDVSTLVDSKVALVLDQYKAGPWYLVVYTKDSNYPIWISHNNIRSVHPGPELCNILIKQFNGEDMVIENVINYELCSASDMCEYDM